MAQTITLDRNPDMDAAIGSSPYKESVGDPSLDDQLRKSGSDLAKTIEEEKALAADHAKKGEAYAEDLKKDRLDLSQNKPPSLPKQEDVPQPKYRDPMEGFGSNASILAVFGSLLTRRPLLNALNASASVINAQRGQDRQAYDDAIQTWKLNFDKAKQMFDWQKSIYDEIIAKIDTDQKLAQAEFIAYGTALGDKEVVRLAQQGMFTEIVNLKKFEYEKFQQAQNHADTIEQRRLDREERERAATENRESHWHEMKDEKSGRIVEVNPVTNKVREIGGKELTPDEVKDLNLGKVGAGTTYKPLSEDEKRTGAVQASTGMPLNQIVSGYGTAATQDRNAVREGAIDYLMSENPGMTKEQAAIELAARTVEFQSGIKPTTAFVSRQTVTLKQALDQLELNLKNVKTEMNKLGSSDISPVINAIYRGEEKWTGDPAYSSLFFFMQAAAQESARILSGGTGSVQQLHEGARSEAEKWASVNMTPASFDAVADAMLKEGRQRLQIAQDALKSIRVKGGPATFGGGGSPLITTRQQFDALPSGTRYREADGNEYTKP